MRYVERNIRRNNFRRGSATGGLGLVDLGLTLRTRHRQILH